MNIKGFLFGGCLAALFLSSCGGEKKQEQGGVKFNPQVKESTMTDSERAEAIAAKRNSLGVPLDSMVGFDGVKFSVVPPAITKDVPANMAEKIARKIIGIAGSNGVGGLCVNPVLGTAVEVNCINRAMTGTAPQKAIAKYEITIYCGNFVSNQIYSSTTLEVSGVGSTFDAAALQAVNEIQNTPQIKEMFKTASQSALAWYNDPANISMLVNQAVAEENYGLAMSLLSSVPSQVDPKVYEMALKRNAEVSEKFFQRKADDLYAKMKGAMAASQGDYNPEVAAYLALIPRGSKVFEEANSLFKNYQEGLDRERDKKAAKEHELALAELSNERYQQTLQFEIDKIKAPYEAQATIEQIRADAQVGVAQAKAEGKKNANTGGFLGLGKLWDGTFQIANRIMDKLDD